LLVGVTVEAIATSSEIMRLKTQKGRPHDILGVEEGSELGGELLVGVLDGVDEGEVGEEGLVVGLPLLLIGEEVVEVDRALEIIVVVVVGIDEREDIVDDVVVKGKPIVVDSENGGDDDRVGIESDVEIVADETGDVVNGEDVERDVERSLGMSTNEIISKKQASNTHVNVAGEDGEDGEVEVVSVGVVIVVDGGSDEVVAEGDVGEEEDVVVGDVRALCASTHELSGCVIVTKARTYLTMSASSQLRHQYS
jgi:hypothetical protein